MAEENSSAFRQFPCACFYSVCGSFRPTSKLTVSSVCCPKLSRTMNRTSAFLSDRLRYHRVNTCRIGSLRSIPAYRPAHGTRGLPAAYGSGRRTIRSLSVSNYIVPVVFDDTICICSVACRCSAFRLLHILLRNIYILFLLFPSLKHEGQKSTRRIHFRRI